MARAAAGTSVALAACSEPAPTSTATAADTTASFDLAGADLGDAAISDSAISDTAKEDGEAPISALDPVFSAACQAMGKAECLQEVACGTTVLSAAECNDALPSNYCALFLTDTFRAVAQGSVHFDLKAMQACLAANASKCDSTYHQCFEAAATGKRKTGDPCLVSAECPLSDACKPSQPGACDGVCTPRALQGANCAAGSLCSQGLYCAKGSCAKVQLGNSCSKAFDDACPPAAHCVEGICTADVALLANCKKGAGDGCTVAASCSVGNCTAVYYLYAGVGGKCDFEDKLDGDTHHRCKAGTWCDPASNSCKAQAMEGEACSAVPSSQSCRAGLDCSQATKSCVAQAGTGAPCTSSCGGNDLCKSGKCVPFRGAVGATCASRLQCASHRCIDSACAPPCPVP